jgi:hypothetical protein
MKASPEAETSSRGSFGIPENIKKAQEKFDSQKKPIRPDAVKPIPQEATQELAQQTEKEATDEIMDKQRSDAYSAINRIEERLGISVEKADIIDFVRKGRIEKREVQIIPGILSVGFRTLTGEEIQEVQQRIHDFQQSNSTTPTAVENESAFWNLTYGLSSYQGKDMTAMTDKSKVRDVLTKVGAHILDKMNSAFVDFNYIVRFKINDTEFVKKS